MISARKNGDFRNFMGVIDGFVGVEMYHRCKMIKLYRTDRTNMGTPREYHRNILEV